MTRIQETKEIDDELSRQCKMAHARGVQLGTFYGIVGTLISALIIKLVF